MLLKSRVDSRTVRTQRTSRRPVGHEFRTWVVCLSDRLQSVNLTATTRNFAKRTSQPSRRYTNLPFSENLMKTENLPFDWSENPKEC
jgi:hypothetical protein